MTLNIITDLEQRSPEWYAARLGFLTASSVGRLITVRKLGALDYPCPACGAEANGPCLSKRGETPTPIKTLHAERTPSAANKTTVIEPASNEDSRSLTLTLAAERIAGFVDPTWVSNDMLRGIYEEPRAVEMYAQHFEPVWTVGFMTEDRWGFKLGYSPDGLVRDDGLIEVKSPRGKQHVRTAVAGGVPFEHMAQIQCGLLVSGRQWCDFISFAGGFQMYVTRVRPDERWQAAIVAAGRLFEANVAEVIAQYREAVDGMPMVEHINYDEEIQVA